MIEVVQQILLPASSTQEIYNCRSCPPLLQGPGLQYTFSEGWHALIERRASLSPGRSAVAVREMWISGVVEREFFVFNFF